jgi:AcrR family transcriptional regulator
MADIAVAAGVSKPLLYHYFPTKTALYRAAVTLAAEELRQATAPLAGGRAALQAHVEWVEANAATYRAVLQGAVCPDDEVHAVVEASRNDTVTRLAGGHAPSELPAEQRMALRGWVGFLEAACLDWLEHRDVGKDRLVDVLLASLKDLARRDGPDRGHLPNGPSPGGQ